MKFLRSELLRLYGPESGKVLGSIGPDHQYSADVSVILESELRD